MNRDVLIAGGGISGLSVAYALSRHGVRCLVTEKEDRLGGLIFTTARDGFLMDAGPDAFLAQKPHATALCEELGLTAELVPTNPEERKVYVLHRGRLHAMPDGMRLTIPTKLVPLLTSPLFTLGGKVRMMAEPFVPARRDDSEESVAAFVARRFGREALERVGEPLLAGIHCGDPEKLSMTRLFPRLVELERVHGSVTRGMLKASALEGPVFLSLRGGMGRLVDRLKEALPSDSVRLGSAVRRVDSRPAGFEVELGSGDAVRCRAVVLALPISDAATLLENVAPDASSELTRIPLVSTAVVFQGFRRADVAHPLDGYGFVVPSGESNRLLAATFVTTKFPGRAREGDVLIRTFLGGTRDPGSLRLSDAELAELSRTELARALGRLGNPLFSRVVRWERRTPQIETGHGDIVAALGRALSRTPGLYVVANGVSGVGIPDSIQTARASADDVVRYLQS